MKLENRILETIKKERKEEDTWHTPCIGVYHASQIYNIISGKLKPKNFFKEQRFNDITLMTFEIGKMYHNHIQSFFKKEECEIKINIKEGDYKIIGRVDLLLNNTPIELKTCSDFPGKPYLAHIYQLQCYLKALEHKTETKHGFITYIKKDKRAFKTMNYKIRQNNEVWQKIISKVNKFHEELKQLNE